MRVLVVGSGGREHAIAWALSKSRRHPEIFIAPGNPGTALVGENVPISVDDLKGLAHFAAEKSIGLCVVGPEVPLVLGLADMLRAQGVGVVGPSSAAARLEGSKAFAKAFMQRHAIPTAEYRTFQALEYDAAAAFIRDHGAPIVVKASGLAAGKGAVVCDTVDAAISALDSMMKSGDFGDSAAEVVIESFMVGEEASLFAFCDGTDFVLLSPAQDHKRIGEGDTGPNTGGMGAYCPAPVADQALIERACREIIRPTLEGMAAEGSPYQGILYVGLMITAAGPQVVEYNCRLGDPETQPVLMLLKSDPLDLFLATANGTLGSLEVEVHPGYAACVVLASEGYPGSYAKGRPITGLEQALAVEGVEVFHAGTRASTVLDGGQPPEGPVAALETSGGRVLGVTAVGDTLDLALERAYRAVDKIHFEGMQFRRDIGKKGLGREV